MTTVGVGAGNLILLNTELEGQSLLQTCRVEGSERSQLVGLQAAVDKSGQSGNVSGVEDHHHVLHVGAILLDVLTEVGGNLTVALQQILAGHASLTGSTT